MPSILRWLPTLLLSLSLISATPEHDQPICHAPTITSPLTGTAQSGRTVTLTGWVNVTSCTPPPPVSTWTYRGCYTESAALGRAVSGGYRSAANMTRGLCTALALDKGHSWAALVYGRECFTGTTLNPSSTLTAESECTDRCAGNATEKCGGVNRASVLQFTTTIPPSGPAPNAPTILIKTAERGQVFRLDTNATGHFSATLHTQPLGLEHWYAVHFRDNFTEALRSNVVALTVNCGRPVIQQPSGNDRAPGYSEYDDVVVGSSRPKISGTSDCPVVTVEITNQAPVRVVVDQWGYWNAQAGQLENGRYTITAVASGTDGKWSTRSNDRNIVVKSTDPRPSAGGNQRRSAFIPQCGKHEELCRFGAGVGGKRRVQYKCYADLSTNLERCGSCAGPDCSALPYVEGVSCQEGKCQVESCQRGYALLDNACRRIGMA